MSESEPGRRRKEPSGRRSSERPDTSQEEITREGASHWAREPVHVWERRWQIPLFEAHDTLGSTNDRLRELGRAGAPPFTVVVAEEQTAGRGRGGSAWHSPAGRGLWMSVLLPRERAGRPPLTPLLVGVAVSRAIRDVAPAVKPGVKWPNDVLVAGRKVCGILCEGEGDVGTVAGVGINVHGDRESLAPDLRARATTLEEEAGGEIRRPELAGALLRILRGLLDPMPETVAGELARELDDLDVLRGRLVETGAGLRGRGAGIAPDGALLVAGSDGEVQRVVAGSVERQAGRERCDS